MMAFRICTTVSLIHAVIATTRSAPVAKHVLQIIVDDLGFSDLSYKGALYNITGTLFPTPFLDSLALTGVRLESTYVHALCSPSRGAFLSGRYAYTTGGNAEVITDGVPDQLPTNIRTVADLLHAHGWATAAFGKWDVGMTTWGCTPLCRGFDHQVGFYNAVSCPGTVSSGFVLQRITIWKPLNNLSFAGRGVFYA
jgi:arylsulfatase A-like enzyme